ncbi:MAG: isoprenyl transferase [Verrucomicrobiales bacterium]|nr:isoprenyl transferase [Verrucomicrobiales bacterium]
MPMIDPALPVPEHIAVIMDGNGRWAKSRGKARNEGHREGAKSVEAIIESCGAIGVKYLTLYAFSSENWKRPRSEVDGLMGLLTHFLKLKTSSLIENNVRLKVIGAVEMLPESSLSQLNKTIEATAENDGLTLYVALSYGSREEIVKAVRTLMQKSADGEITPDELTVENFGDYLYTADCPDPDLLIRTSGEFRISNFLLWQISYSEIYITDVYWPDFRRSHLEEAIADYQRRHRRYGGL